MNELQYYFINNLFINLLTKYLQFLFLLYCIIYSKKINRIYLFKRKKYSITIFTKITKAKFLENIKLLLV